MRIAIVHTRQGQIFLFQVKGRKKELSDIDGFHEYFGTEDGWDIDEIDQLELAHLGTGDAVVITPKTDIDVHGRGMDIIDWLPDPDEEE